MEFLQPAFLWGFLAVAIPVIIHFWYQKKGKVIAWAASQWLTDKTSLQHRGLRLDEIPLLLLRCLLVILFVLLLGKPIVNWFKSSKTTEKIHLVEPNNNLVNNFRFELESAIKKGEKVYWIGPESQELKDISIPLKRAYSELYLQESIQKFSKPGKELNLYITNSNALTELPKIYVPDSFKLFSSIDSSGKVPNNYLDLGDGKRLFVNQKPGESRQLKVGEAKDNDPASSFSTEPERKGNILVLLDYKNPVEQETVQAGLLALSEVYSIPFVIDLLKKPANKYDWIITDREIKNINPETLYIISGKGSGLNINENVIEMPDSVRLQTSELVQNGQLPEWLGNIMINHYKLKQNTNPLSQLQLKSLFVLVKPIADQSTDKLYQWLLLFFILTLLLERWIALRKTISQTYA